MTNDAKPDRPCRRGCRRPVGFPGRRAGRSIRPARRGRGAGPADPGRLPRRRSGVLRPVGAAPDGGRRQPPALPAVRWTRRPVRGGRAVPGGDRRPVRQRLRHRPDAARVVPLHLLPGLSRHAGDADAEERLRQRRQRRHEDPRGSPPDAVHDLSGPRGPRVGPRRHGADRRRVPRPLPVDGRGQPGQAGGLRQRAGSGAGRGHRGMGRLHGGAARARHSPRHPLRPRERRRTDPLPAADGEGAGRPPRQRHRLGPHGPVAGADHHGPGPARPP